MKGKDILIIAAIAVGAVMAAAMLSQGFRRFVVTGGQRPPVLPGPVTQVSV